MSVQFRSFTAVSLTKAKNCSPMYWHRRKINKAWRCPFTVHYSDNNFMGDLNHVSYQWKRGEPPCKRKTGCRKKARCEQWQDTLGDLLRESPDEKDDFFFSCASDAILSSRLKESWLKGTQEWEFFWLRFWILYYFIVIYVKILRFCKKNFLIGPVLEEVRFSA
jgi:hypothetical protein